jgi:hypothetical protein
LVTDIGNDLLYEVPVDRIVDWVDQCLDRLKAINARGMESWDWARPEC